MPRPIDCEFSKKTIVEALMRSSFCCERCGISKHETFEGYLEIHHLLQIAIAVEKYPELSHAVISSLANARVLCHKCHLIEDRIAREQHAKEASRLKNLNLALA